jgi:hypothetical protein
LKPQYPLLAISLTALVLWTHPQIAVAGCGCQKPPPRPAALRPDATYAGAQVTLFNSALQEGQTYSVVFTSGITGQSASAQGMVIAKRDLADGVVKPQLSVPVPALPVGPTSIQVSMSADESVVTTVDDAAFTIIPTPVTIPAQLGEYNFQNFQAAVSRDGTVYLSLDMTQVSLPMTFEVQAKGYPVHFGNTDVVFYNTQGFLMQTLTQGIPGLFTIQTAGNATDSDTLRYSRHEFVTFYVQHAERRPHQLDATDPNWHLDGTAHVDHNHLVLALMVRFSDGSTPLPGATPAFELVLRTVSLFSNGLVGVKEVKMTDSSTTSSFNSRTGLTGKQGNIVSNGTIELSKNAVVHGSVKAKTITIKDSAKVTGSKSVLSQPLSFLPVVLPTGLKNLGNVDIRDGQLKTVQGPASYQVANLNVGESSRLVIDNTLGPVTLYVTGNVSLSKYGAISVTDPNPEKFAIYVTESGNVSLSGQTQFYGVIYAPNSVVRLSDRGQFFGSYVGSQITLDKDAVMRFDSALLGR